MRANYAILIVACIALLVATVVVAAGSHNAYLPVIRSVRTDGLGLEVVPNYTHNQPGLADIGALTYRSTFGSQVDPYYGPYQKYLSGGWAAVDLKFAMLDDWRALGAQPQVVFMRGGLPCKVPTIAQLGPYGDFIVAAVERYDLHTFEIANEPDASGGYPSLFGCWGKAYADRLIYLLDYVQARVPSHRQVGVSFQAASPAQFAMLAATASHADWVGLHFYPVWSAGVVLYPWPGGLATLVTMAEQYSDDVRVTEFNLRDPASTCGAAFEQAQADEIEAALDLGLPMLSVLVYYPAPDWQCTGIENTLTEQMLMGTGYPAPGQE